MKKEKREKEGERMKKEGGKNKKEKEKRSIWNKDEWERKRRSKLEESTK